MIIFRRNWAGILTIELADGDTRFYQNNGEVNMFFGSPVQFVIMEIRGFIRTPTICGIPHIPHIPHPD